MSGRSLCVPHDACQGKDGLGHLCTMLREMQRASPCLGPPRAPVVPTPSPLNAGPGRAPSNQFRFDGAGVEAALCRWHQTSSTASSTVCHRFCSGSTDANIANNVIVARIFGL